METNKLPRPSKLDYALIEIYNKNSDDYHNLYNAFDWSAEVYEENGNYGLKNCLGEILIKPHYQNFMLLSGFDIKMGSKVVTQINNKWGILIADGEGLWMTEPDYDYIGYPNNITYLCKNGKWGVMNLNTREWILPLNCDSLSHENGFLFSNGIAFYELNGKHGILLINGEFTQPVFDEIDHEINYAVKVRIGNKWGYADKSGQLVDDIDEAYFCGTDL